MADLDETGKASSNLKVNIKIEPWFSGLLEVCSSSLRAEVEAGRMSLFEAEACYTSTFKAGWRHGSRIS